jgi:hypothetical protein
MANHIAKLYIKHPESRSAECFFIKKKPLGGTSTASSGYCMDLLHRKAVNCRGCVGTGCPGYGDGVRSRRRRTACTCAGACA